MHPPIDCALHDYLEIACLFRYHVRFTLTDGSSVEGRAVTTVTLKDRTEVVQLSGSSGLVIVPMHALSLMEVLTPRARFSVVEFSEGNPATCGQRQLRR